MNENEMGRAFRTYGRGEAGWRNLREKDRLAYVVIHGRMVQK